MTERGQTDLPPLPAKPYGFPREAFDWTRLPDVETDFLPPEHLEAFIQALAAPDPIQSPDETQSLRLSSPSLQSTSNFFASKRQSVAEPDPDSVPAEHDTPRAVASSAAAQTGELSSTPAQQDPKDGSASVSVPSPPAGLVTQGINRSNSNLFITAQSDWAPVHEKVQGKRAGARRLRTRDKSRRSKGRVRKALGQRSTDETREGYLYGLLKWPFLFTVSGWLLGLSIAYLATRTYIALYEQWVTLRGRREKLRREMRSTGNYRDWVAAAKQLDDFLGNGKWKEENEFAYYDSKTVRRVWDQMRRCRLKAEDGERDGEEAVGDGKAKKAVEDLKALVEACAKNNFVGIENPRLYSQTYYGTKNLVQNFVDEVEKSIRFLKNTRQLELEEKRVLFKGIHANYGRTALCLSGGATFAYYHFGVVKALLEENYLPDIITGTSGGALVAGLVATRTNDELKQLLVPALAHRITACYETFPNWVYRWWKTGARFDSIDWAKKCSWFTRGSMTFREAYERTGRILNVSCVPADPHSPTILCNYLTSPDCVIWSAVLASAAVPGILNPAVLMMKTRDGQLVPYSFGHKWKDGSLRTDIPIKALNLHFNVNFTIVSQVNPHINLFFFSSRGSVGQPVTHRKGRGWRGGYLGSAAEQYIKLDLTKWLKVLRQLELLPRPLGQDWSQLWLQQFGGTVTIWPKSILSDFWNILTDPDEARLAGMLHEGQQSAFPKIKFVSNRLRVERLIEQARRETRPYVRRGSIETLISEDDLRSLLRVSGGPGDSATVTEDETTDADLDHDLAAVVGATPEDDVLFDDPSSENPLATEEERDSKKNL